ncbi:MAG: radical SAM protein, partial [Firmicutes bacterium]|nr:radical SAM protein [Bacillota bacterium]
MASYELECNLPGNIPNMENMVRAVDPEAVFTSGAADFRIAVTISGTKQELTCQGRIDGRQSAQVTFTDREIGDPRYDLEAFTQRQKELVRKGVLILLQKIGRPAPPWGILTGVRPSKLYHYLRDLGFSPAEVKDRLQAQFMLVPEKAAHLAAVGEVQRPLLQEVAGRIGIYIGIPFCPTRCHYCSFASYPLATHGHLVEGFLAALAYEIAEIGKTLTRLGHAPATIYIRGGTPTVLTPVQLRDLLARIGCSFPRGELLEYTVEAGRPDTLDRTKLALLRDYGVTRVSVNPQTINPQTLARIGRRHTVEQVEAAVALVRALEFPCLNMDMILGLPGEQEADWDD